ncbi:MAG TPA: UDP-N-acetylmuramate dehydrogenase [Syntrophorhabdaceae bacterium]|nr:UDP-N-acetylmuramate dehydrogenase [Syntrophorhabdaceae bacterium]
MKRYTSMKVGGQVPYLVYPRDQEDLVEALRRLQKENYSFRILGNGTNIIVSDKGIDTVLVRLTKMKYLRYENTGEGSIVDVSGGASLRLFIKDLAERELGGLEKLYWIPGTVGGGVRMNAGSFGQSISDTLEEVTIANCSGNVSSIGRKHLKFGYRLSPVGPADCVVSARFRLMKKKKSDILRDMQFVYSERKKRHPMEYPSAGSVFKSANDEPAWKFIERAGLKGYSIGQAQVSEKHANFIINRGRAKAKDVWDLIQKIKSEVYQQLGVTLHEEVELWGFNG